MYFYKNWYLFIMFIGFSGMAQEYTFKQSPLLFYDNQSKQPIIIDNDSIIIKIKEKTKIPLKNTNYPSTLNEYLPFSIGNKNYFVHNGCGPVLEYRNDSIIRIDNSFMHRNQFEAASFVYNNEIYFFGGYGLFTLKNILVKYSFQHKEWIEVNTSGNLPQPQSSTKFEVDNNFLFLIGGYTAGEVYNNKWVYKLNLKTLVWERFSNANSAIEFSKIKFKKIFKSTYFASDGIYNLNFKANKLNRYALNYFGNNIGSVVDKDTIYTIIHSRNLSKDQKFILKKIYSKSLFGKKISENIIYTQENQYMWLYISILFLCASVFLFYKNRMYFNYIKKPNKPFYYKPVEQQFYFKGKRVKNLSDDNIKILDILAAQNETYISLHIFNNLFTEDVNNENYSTIIKRREKKLDTFLNFLSSLSGFDLQKIFLERKNNKDKRIKEISILPNLIRFK